MEDFEATLPPNYREVIGEIIIVEKTDDENEKVDIDSSPEKSDKIIVDKTADQNEVDSSISDLGTKRSFDSSLEDEVFEQLEWSDPEDDYGNMKENEESSEKDEENMVVNNEGKEQEGIEEWTPEEMKQYQKELVRIFMQILLQQI